MIFAVLSECLSLFSASIMNGNVTDMLTALRSVDTVQEPVTARQQATAAQEPVVPRTSTAAAEDEPVTASTVAPQPPIQPLPLASDTNTTAAAVQDAVMPHTSTAAAEDEPVTASTVAPQPLPLASVSNTTNVRFKPIPKARGRPAAGRQRPFKVMGKRKRTNENVEDDRCVECGRADPPAEVNRDRQVDWIACDQCSYWYHKCCLGTATLPKKKRDMLTVICSRCHD